MAEPDGFIQLVLDPNVQSGIWEILYGRPERLYRESYSELRKYQKDIGLDIGAISSVYGSNGLISAKEYLDNINTYYQTDSGFNYNEDYRNIYSIYGDNLAVGGRAGLNYRGAALLGYMEDLVNKLQTQPDFWDKITEKLTQQVLLKEIPTTTTVTYKGIDSGGQPYSFDLVRNPPPTKVADILVRPLAERIGTPGALTPLGPRVSNKGYVPIVGLLDPMFKTDSSFTSTFTNDVFIQGDDVYVDDELVQSDRRADYIRNMFGVGYTLASGGNINSLNGIERQSNERYNNFLSKSLVNNIRDFGENIDLTGGSDYEVKEYLEDLKERNPSAYDEIMEKVELDKSDFTTRGVITRTITGTRSGGPNLQYVRELIQKQNGYISRAEYRILMRPDFLQRRLKGGLYTYLPASGYRALFTFGPSADPEDDTPPIFRLSTRTPTIIPLDNGSYALAYGDRSPTSSIT